MPSQCDITHLFTHNIFDCFLLGIVIPERTHVRHGSNLFKTSQSILIPFTYPLPIAHQPPLLTSARAGAKSTDIGLLLARDRSYICSTTELRLELMAAASSSMGTGTIATQVRDVDDPDRYGDDHRSMPHNSCCTSSRRLMFRAARRRRRP